MAPLALITVLVAFLVIVTGSGGGSNGSANDSSTTPSMQTTTKQKKPSSARTKKTSTNRTATRRTYTVQVGDTLGGIADKTGVPLQRIEELNPNVDPHTLNAGQQIRLR